ncbi:uncharacterized protein LOC132056470 [Lycium ferocissimum]|uniref:uncharacterized protein LOC132056470 n=1 Tax=Lycium ferocissimum TaxID=112874 RepID=UPI0028168334|nr:uncharacterized protein LOC132056470 [Lycium ferocissimum]XP_059304673.1 uncharacterized protein LOC132056470 [Lycium ferocissimum]
MDCTNESLIVDMGLVVGRGDTTNSVSGLKRESGYCNQCLNLEAKIKTIEYTCSSLRQEIDQERKGFKLLEGKFEALRVEKLAVEDELEVLKRRNQELEERIRKIENNNESNEENEEEDKVLQLMIENSFLECEKRKAESDVEYWKSKCNELQLTVAELDKKLAQKTDLEEVYKIIKVDEMQNKAGLDANPFFSDGEIGSLQSQDSGKYLAKTPSVQAKLVGGNQVKKRLTFEEGKGPNKRMAPSTPAGVRPAKVVVIDINESDDERTTGPLCTSIIGSDYETSVPLCTPPVPGIARSVPYCGSGSTLSNIELPSENNLKITDIEQGEDSDMVCDNKEVLCVPTPKRRRASNIIASDSDTDNDDDKVPICMLKSRHFCEKSSDDHPRSHSSQTGDSDEAIGKSSSRRRLVKLSQFEGKGGGGNDFEEEVSESEGESLGGFIVSSSDISDDDDISNSDGALQSNSSVAEDSITDSEHISESDSDYGEILSRIRRNKSEKLEWEFEGDMLAAFGKDPELCMKAVCVLYRQQTSEEQCSKETIFHNQRGFSHCDAFRGSTLAEFLTDGDPQGDMKKSLKELQAYDPKGVEVCITLATRYSKQLFAIYKNKEDPFFSAP